MAHNECNKAEILMPEKGPKVFLDYDQAALDAAYDQAAYAPNREQLVKRRIREGAYRESSSLVQKPRNRLSGISAPVRWRLEFFGPWSGSGFWNHEPNRGRRPRWLTPVSTERHHCLIVL